MHLVKKKRRDAPDSLLKKNKDLWLYHESSREDARVPCRKDAIRKQGLVERCEDLQKQGRAVECCACSQRLLLLEVKNSCGTRNPRQSKDETH